MLILANVLTHFNPRSPCGERPLPIVTLLWTKNFNPRSPCGERPRANVRKKFSLIFQSTLPMRGATLIMSAVIAPWVISIHAPHAGSDKSPHGPNVFNRHFNPRSPCGERQPGGQSNQRALRFQSTLPMRGATDAKRGRRGAIRFQSTLPMRGATCSVPWRDLSRSISIHAPHAGSDYHGHDCNSSHGFQSTLPMRGATFMSLIVACLGYFNPRSPCGERPDHDQVDSIVVKISIHAPHAGSDKGVNMSTITADDFNPRSPCGERRFFNEEAT